MIEPLGGATAARPPNSGCIGRTIALACTIFSAAMCAMIFAWLVGRVWTDRYFWTQWLFWIPTPALLPVVLIGLAASFRPGSTRRQRRNRVVRWCATAAALLAYFLMVEHRFLRAAPDITTTRSTPGQLRLVHWNAQHPPAAPDTVIEQLRLLDGDVMFITDINWATWLTIERDDPLGPDVQTAHFGALAVFSRLPIVSFRPLVAVDLIFVLSVEIDATQLLGRTLHVYFVDMPSDPRLPRAEQMRRARALLETATAPHPPPIPDVVVGDLNVPRNAASISMLFAGMHEAFNEGGHGYGATYHRAFPLYHIDHILLADALSAARCDLHDPGHGRHLAQIAWIKPRRN